MHGGGNEDEDEMPPLTQGTAANSTWLLLSYPDLNLPELQMRPLIEFDTHESQGGKTNRRGQILIWYVPKPPQELFSSRTLKITVVIESFNTLVIA